MWSLYYSRKTWGDLCSVRVEYDFSIKDSVLIWESCLDSLGTDTSRTLQFAYAIEKQPFLINCYSKDTLKECWSYFINDENQLGLYSIAVTQVDDPKGEPLYISKLKRVLDYSM